MPSIYPTDENLKKHTYGMYISSYTYKKLKEKFYEIKSKNSNIKTYDDFILYLLQENIPTY